MRHGLLLGALLLTACGTDLVSVTDAGSDGTEVSSGSLGSSESGELGDGDGDGDAGDGDADTADDGDEYPSPFHCDFGPGCYVIHDGSILLDANSTPADFAALECVVEVTGDLVIDGIDSTNLHFLESLRRVGQNLRISNNAALSSMIGLDNLTQVGGTLTIVNNALDSLSGLESLTSATRIELLGPAGDYASLHGLDNLSSVSESLIIGTCACAPDEGDCSEDFGLERLVSLDGLESLVSVGRLEIWGNRVLADVDALVGLGEAQAVVVADNPAVSDEDVLAALAGVVVSEPMQVSGNGSGEAPVCGLMGQ